jgi:hypothetical protein
MNTPISCPKCGSTTEVKAADSVELHTACALTKGTTAVFFTVGTILTGGIIIPICAGILMGGVVAYILTEENEKTCSHCHHRWS